MLLQTVYSLIIELLYGIFYVIENIIIFNCYLWKQISSNYDVQIIWTYVSIEMLSNALIRLVDRTYNLSVFCSYASVGICNYLFSLIYYFTFYTVGVLLGYKHYNLLIVSVVYTQKNENGMIIYSTKVAIDGK